LAVLLSINFLPNRNNIDVVNALLLTNIVSHLSGISADCWGTIDGALTIGKMGPVEITQLLLDWFFNLFYETH
jgi:hypothetical protein